MQSPQALTLSELQQFIEHPEQLANQPVEYQLAVANYSEAPRQLLEVLANSTNFQVAEAASMHVNLAGEAGEDWQEIAEAVMKTAPLGQNDRLVAELLKFAPVPEVLVSEWMPGHRLIEGIENPYMAPRHRVKLLQRLALSPIIEERLKAAAHQDTPYATLEQLAGDLELPIRIAIKYHSNSPTKVIEQIEAQHEIAHNWETNPEELAVLANSPWSWIRLAVARNPYTPHETLAKLAQDSEEKIQLAVARNLFTPAEVLDLLVNHYYQEVTEAIAKHPNASEQALIKLIPRHAYYIKQRFYLSAGILEALANYNNNIYNTILVRNPNTPGSALAKLIFSDLDISEQCELEQHPNVLITTLESLAKKLHPSIRVNVYKNQKTPEPLKKQLIQDLLNEKKLAEDYQLYIDNQLVENKIIFEDITVEDIRQELSEAKKIPKYDYEIAHHPETPPHILEQLATTSAANGVAENPNTPPHVLTQLAKHESSYVCNSVAKNPSTPLNTLIEIISNSKLKTYSDYIKFAYQYPNLPRLELYRILLVKEAEEEAKKMNNFITHNRVKFSPLKAYLDTTQDNIEARCSLARMHDTPISILEELAKDSYAEVRAKVSKNPNLPLHCLIKLAKDPVVYVRQALAYRDVYNQAKITPIEIFEILVVDEAQEVRKEIARNPRTPVNILSKLAKDSSLEVKKIIAKNPNTPVDALEQLWQEDKLFEPKNHNTSSHIVAEVIAKTSDSEKLTEILESSFKSYAKIPASSLEKLATHKNDVVRSNVAGHPNTPISVLERLIDDKYRVTQWALAKNPNTPPYLLEELLKKWGKDADGKCHHELCRRLAERSDTPPSVFEYLASMDNYNVREAVAINQSTPEYILEKLANRNFLKQFINKEHDIF